MPIGYLQKDKQSFYLTDAFHIDLEGNIYFLFTIEQRKIQKYNKQLTFVSDIDVSELIKNTRRDGTLIYYTGVIKDIFIINPERIAVSMNDDHVVIINPKGNILDRYPDDPKSQKEQFVRHFQRLEDGHLLMLSAKGFYGNVAAISSSKNPFVSFPFASKLVTDTLLFDNDTLEKIPLLDASGRNKDKAIGSMLHDRKMNYRHTEGTPYTHYSSVHQIKQIIEINETTLLALVMTDGKNKSNSPDKNMPYFLFLLDRATGVIKKEWSPDDRSIYKHNIRGRMIKLSNGNILLKTFDAIYILNEQIEVVETISLEDRALSSLRKLSILGGHENTLYLADHDKGYFLTYPLNFPLIDSFKQLPKDLRKAKKEWKKANEAT